MTVIKRFTQNDEASMRFRRLEMTLKGERAIVAYLINDLDQDLYRDDFPRRVVLFPNDSLRKGVGK